MGKRIEESLPRNPSEAERMPDAGWQVNRVVVLETGNNRQFDTPPKSIPQPVDDARRG
jgi:hypothetical protein